MRYCKVRTMPRTINRSGSQSHVLGEPKQSRIPSVNGIGTCCNTRFAPVAAGCLTCVGMSLPWAHVGRLAVSGWAGSANVFGVTCPGFLVAVVAAIAIRCLCGARTEARRRWLTLLAMCAYGIFHSGFMALALTVSPQMSAGVGIPITISSFVVLVFSAFHAD